MKRSRVGLNEILAWPNMVAAFYRAASGKRLRADIQAFEQRLDRELDRMVREIKEGRFDLGRNRSFRIFDPKPRIIHAPRFQERVLHHAIMAHAGPVLDKALVDDTYACRVGKGSLAAIKRCQHHLQRYSWFGKIDIRSYFASIDHGRLKNLLHHRFKDQTLLGLFGSIIDRHHVAPGKGLPIGALTSQHFANAYLGDLDRLLLERCKVRGMVRYMDDVLWWCDERDQVRDVLAQVVDFLRDDLMLTVKSPVMLGRSQQGLLFCGYRVLPGALLLSRRRKRRYADLRRRCEQDFLKGHIGTRQLQQGYSTAFALTAHADASRWRGRQLFEVPLEPLLADV